MQQVLIVLTVFLFATLSGCTTVPNEVVQLANVTTNDTRALNDGYRKLVRTHFNALRQVREREIADEVFMPFIEDSIKEAQLEDVILGKKVYDPKLDALVDPTPGKASLQKLETINTWAREVSEFMNTVRKNAFKDLDKAESNLLDEIDMAFGNVIRGGTTIHAYLLSLQKVESAQKNALDAIGLGDLPNKLNGALAKASEDAAKWTANTDIATEKVSFAKRAVKDSKAKISKEK